MPEVELPFSNQEGASDVAQNSRESLVNMFCEVETSGRSRLIRRQRPGVKSETTLSGTKRAIERYATNHHHVTGTTLYSYDGSTNTSLGTISGSGRCSIAFGDGGASDILVSNGTSLFHYNGSSVSSVTLPSGVQAGTVDWLAGRGLFPDVGSHKFYYTDSGDLTTIDGASFASAEANPDHLVRLFVDHSEIWLFGKVSTEVWGLTGNSDAPYARIGNAHMERGCAAEFSVASDDNTLFWLGDDLNVYRADGFRPLRISNHTIERAIAGVSASGISSAEAWVYTIGGNKFYTLKFPSELTVQYNIATGFWNRCETYQSNSWDLLGSAGHRQDYWLTTTGLVSLEQGLCTDEGGIMRRGGVSAPMYAGGKRIFFRSYFLDAEVGRAPANTDADVMLRVALDGESWGNERVRSLGEIGEYRRRAVWRNLGTGRDISVEFYISDATEFQIMGAGGNVQVGSS